MVSRTPLTPEVNEPATIYMKNEEEILYKINSGPLKELDRELSGLKEFTTVEFTTVE